MTHPRVSTPWDYFHRDAQTTDVLLNGARSTYIDRGSGLEAGDEAVFDDAALKLWVLDQLSRAGRTWDARHPFVDLTAVVDAGLHVRIHAVFPPASPTGVLVSLRRLSRSASGLLSDREQAKAAASGRWPGAGFLLALQSLRQGDSLLISGGTGSGKTTLLNDLLTHCGDQDRVIALEDTPELAPEHPHFIALLSRPANSDGFGEVSLRALLRQTLRMRPDRIVLGECRGDEVLDLLQALNTGHQGALATLHANSARDALRRLELLTLIASRGTLSSPLARELIACGVRTLVHVARGEHGRAIHEVHRIEGREGDTILLRPLLNPRK